MNTQLQEHEIQTKEQTPNQNIHIHWKFHPIRLPFCSMCNVYIYLSFIICMGLCIDKVFCGNKKKDSHEHIHTIYFRSEGTFTRHINQAIRTWISNYRKRNVLVELMLYCNNSQITNHKSCIGSEFLDAC